MAHYITRWSLVSVTLFLLGPAALAQTYPPPEQPPPAEPPMSQPDSPPPEQPPMSQAIPGPAMQPPPRARAAAGFISDCAQALQRFCYGVQPGEGRLIRCLLSHRGRLSPACMSRVAAARPGPGVPPPSYRSTQSPGLPSAGPPMGHAATESAMRASCGPDVQRLCTGVARENGGVIKCLSSHRVELSPTCDAFLREMPARRAAQKSAPSNNVPSAPKTMPPAADGPAAAGAPPAANSPPATGAPPAANSPPAASAPAIPQ
jgi:hypothetical protein